MIYLDHNSASPLRPAALDAMHYAARVGGNPSSSHGLGRAARRLVDAAHEQVRKALNGGAGEVLWTASGAEANALGVHGLAEAGRRAAGRRVVVIADVGNARLLPIAAALQARGFVLRQISVKSDGRLCLAAAQAALTAEVGVVWLTMADEDTGVLQPVSELAHAARAVGAAVHLDATAAVGKVVVDFTSLGVDAIALCGHKLGGPAGVAALMARKGAALAPLWSGGGQQRGTRPGTEPVPLIVGLGVATIQAVSPTTADLRCWRDALERGVRDLPGGLVAQVGEPRLPNTALVGLKGVLAADLVAALSHRGVMVGMPGPAAGAYLGEQGRWLVRVSLGWSSQEKDVIAAAAAMEAVARGDREAA